MPPPLSAQTVVITGASSGIGRATALRFAESGSRVVLAARNELALQHVASEIRNFGGEAMSVITDVSDWEQVKNLAAQAADTYGRIDTWVNNAGVGVYATAEDTTVDETHQVMQTNYMGMVHGVKAVLPYMRRQHSGTIINVGSVESERALPYNSAYSATKHAVKGYTEALRMELKHAHTGIKVTLILPSGINTPFFNHARSKLGVMPQPAPPAYTPELVAQAITHAAEYPQRDMYIGGAGKLYGIMERISPGFTDWLMMMGGTMFRLQKSHKPDSGQDSLFQTIPEVGRINGDFPHLVKPSMYTPIFELTPASVRFPAMLAVAGALFAFFTARTRR